MHLIPNILHMYLSVYTDVASAFDWCICTETPWL